MVTKSTIRTFYWLAMLAAVLLAATGCRRDEHAPPATAPSSAETHADQHGHESESPEPADAHDEHDLTESGEAGRETVRLSAETAENISLDLAEVRVGPVQEVLELAATVEADPDRRYVVTPRTAGRVLAVRAQLGDPIRSGQVLVEIDSPQQARNIYEARKLEAEYQRLLVQITQARGRIDQLTIDLETAERSARIEQQKLQRMESAPEAVSLNARSEQQATVMKLQSAARSKAVEIKVAGQEAEAMVAEARSLKLSRDALLAVSNIDPQQVSAIDSAATMPESAPSLSLVRLTSPIDGMVIARSAKPGQGVEAGHALLEIADYRAVQIHGELPETLIARVTDLAGLQARVHPRSDPPAAIPAKVRFISPVVDPVKRTVHLVAEADNTAGLLRDGAYVNLAVVVRAVKNALVVPRSAVLQEGPACYVFVRTGDDHTFQRKEIGVGLRDDAVIEVLHGLNSGDVVVSRGTHGLSQLWAANSTTIAPGSAGHDHNH